MESIEKAKKIIDNYLREIGKIGRIGVNNKTNINDKNKKINKNINNSNNNINNFNNKNKNTDNNNSNKDNNDDNTKIVPISDCVGKTIVEDIVSNIDVPPFDRSKMDGYAVKSEDTYNCDEDNPITLKIVGKVMAGDVCNIEIKNGECVEIGTGAPIPNGANAVVMVEYTEKIDNNHVKIYSPVAPYENIQYCGSDIMVGELVVRENTTLYPQDIGGICAIGKDKVRVKVSNNITIIDENNNKDALTFGIISTGNELIPPGKDLKPFKIYDVNTYTLIGEILQNGWKYNYYGIVKDDENDLKEKILKAIDENDIVLLSGGTSAGVGDLTSKVIEDLGGEILIHGIKIKPGKPTIIGKLKNKLIVGLPGYPTSCLTVFNVLFDNLMDNKLTAHFPLRYISSKGRVEYLPISVVKGRDGYKAYPITKGSGAITSLTNADGFVIIDEDKEIIEDEDVQIRLFGNLRDRLNIIGSHCIGVDEILRKGKILAKTINVGSLGGIMAIKRGESDISGIHLISDDGTYNIPFLKKYKVKNALLIRGYIRKQGFMFKDESITSLDDILKNIKNYRFINRNKSSGTRILFDRFLKEHNINPKDINGYNFESKTHSSVGASIAMGRADIGIGIETVAKIYNLKFIPIGNEHYDFLVNKDSFNNEDVEKFIKTLKEIDLPFEKCKDTGKIIYEC